MLRECGIAGSSNCEEQCGDGGTFSIIHTSAPDFRLRRIRNHLRPLRVKMANNSLRNYSGASHLRITASNVVIRNTLPPSRAVTRRNACLRAWFVILPGVMPLGRPPGVAGVALLKAAVQRRLPSLHETVRLGTRMAGACDASGNNCGNAGYSRRTGHSFPALSNVPDGVRSGERHPVIVMMHGFGMDLQTWGWHTGGPRAAGSVRLSGLRGRFETP